MDLKPKGESHLGKMWTFVLYPMEPLAQRGVFGPPQIPPPHWLQACVTNVSSLSDLAVNVKTSLCHSQNERLLIWTWVILENINQSHNLESKST